MGVVNLAIKIKRLIKIIKKTEKEVDALKPQNYTFKWDDSTDLETYANILTRCIAGLPVRVFYSNNQGRQFIFDGFYYRYSSDGVPLMLYGFSGKDRFGLTFTVDDVDVLISLTSFS